eukprot:symbB.v1.2.005116.t1/scaffold295.1/size237168/5
MSLLTTAFVTSVHGVAKIVLICAAGAYLEKAGILHKEMRKGVSEMFVKLLLPCLLFTRILPTISVETLPKLAWLAAANLVYVSMGLLIGSLSVLVCQPGTQSMRRILTATPAIGHANSIPFLLVGLIVTQDPTFGEDDASTAQGYVALYLIMHSITLWGVGMNVIKEKEDDPPNEPPDIGIDGIGHADHGDLPLPTVLGRSEPSAVESPPRASRLSTLKSWIPGWLNRPMATAMFTAILGFIPGAKGFFVSGPLRTVFGAMSSLGTAGPSISLLSVGALFVADGLPRPSLVGYVPLFALIVGRLIILPACCIALWMTLRRHVSFFPRDPALMLVMCIECCTPTAYNLVTVCILKGIRTQQLTTGLFYQSLTAIFALTAWTTVIVYWVV